MKVETLGDLSVNQLEKAQKLTPEAPGNSMRMHELAVESTLSPSGVTRLIDRCRSNEVRRYH